MKKSSYRKIIILSVFFLYILFSSSIFLINNSIYYTDIKTRMIQENLYSSKVSENFILQERDSLVKTARAISNEGNLYIALKNKLYVHFERDPSSSSPTKMININPLSYKKLVSSYRNITYGVNEEFIKHELDFYDKDGNLLATTMQRSENTSIDKKYIKDSIGNDLKGKGNVQGSEIGLFEISGTKILIKGLAPVRSFYSENYGTVLITEKLNNFLIDSIKKLVNKEIIVVIDNKITYSTIFGSDEKNQTIIFDSKNIENKTKQFYELNIDKKKMVFSFFPITDYNNNIIAYIGTGFYYDTLYNLYLTNMKRFLVYLTTFSILLLLLLSLIMKFLFAPFESVVKKIKEIANGDYKKIEDKKGIGELQILVESTNNLAAAVMTRENELTTLNSKLVENNEKLNQTLTELSATQKQMIRSEKLSAIGEFASSISHEIKNPIGVILTTSQMMNYDISKLLEKYKGDMDIKEIKDSNDTIEAAARQAKEIIINVLDYSRLEEDSSQALDLNKAVYAATLLLKKDFLKNKISITTNLNDIPKIRGKTGEITQIMINFLINSRDAIIDKAITDGHIIIETLYEEPNIILKIQDNGIGMSDETKTRIFDPFFTTKPEGKGTGLGMTIISKILQKYNAIINVESSLGEGTEMKVIFLAE